MNRRLKTGRLLTILLCIALIAVMIPVVASAKSTAKLPAGPRMRGAANASTGVRVTWNSSASATGGYRIFRKVKPKDPWKAIAEVNAGVLSYTDKKAVSGTTYYYAVRGINTRGKVSTEFSANPQKILYIAAPQMQSAEVTDRGMQVTWDAVTGAKLYRVYRAQGTNTDPPDASYKEIGTSKTNTFLDKKAIYGQGYAYKVKVVSTNNRTVLSAWANKPVYTFFSQKVQIASITNRDDDILVKWKKVKGIARYRVFRKVANGDWDELTPATGTTRTKIIDDGSVGPIDILNNVTYTYVVRGCDANGDFIGDYDSAGKSTVFHKGPILLGCVRNNETGALQTSWDAVEGVSNYIVYRRIRSNNWVQIGTSTMTTYSDTSMPSGTWCEYTVACADAVGTKVSGYGYLKNSNKRYVGATSYLDKPVLVSAKDVFEVTATGGTNVGVRLTWKDVDTTPVQFVKTYNIYRYVTQDTDDYQDPVTPQWGVEYETAIPGTVLPDGSITWLDKNVKNCEKYVYTVCISNGGNRESMRDENGIAVTYYTPPKAKKIRNALEGVEFSWKKVVGVGNYKIWRKTGNTDWTEIANVNGAAVNYTYIDTNVVSNGTYWYSVSSVGNSEGDFRKPGRDIIFYAAPYIKEVKNCDSSITVEWEQVEGITRFQVEVSRNGGGWVQLTSAAGTDELSYKFTGNSTVPLRSGDDYRFRIGSISGGAVVSGFRITQEIKYLSKPDINTYTCPAQGQARITWGAVVGADSYIIYKQLYPGGAWEQAGTTEDNTILIRGLLRGGNYYQFKVVAVGGNSISAESNAVRLWVKSLELELEGLPLAQ